MSKTVMTAALIIAATAIQSPSAMAQAPALNVVRAEPAEPPLPANGPASFDVAGVKLGMDPTRVRQALVRAGYAVEAESRDGDFATRVAGKVATLRQKPAPAGRQVTSELRTDGPAGERLTIAFRPWPAGPRVSGIAFNGTPGRQTPEAFKAQITGKFGQPTFRMADGGRWCAAEEKGCAPLDHPRLPMLEANYYSQSIWLREGPGVEEGHRALVEREARRIVPLNDRASF